MVDIRNNNKQKIVVGTQIRHTIFSRSRNLSLAKCGAVYKAHCNDLLLKWQPLLSNLIFRRFSLSYKRHAPHVCADGKLLIFVGQKVKERKICGPSPKAYFVLAIFLFSFKFLHFRAAQSICNGGKVDILFAFCNPKLVNWYTHDGHIFDDTQRSSFNNIWPGTPYPPLRNFVLMLLFQYYWLVVRWRRCLVASCS